MSVATVDERIAGLEHRRATETLTLKEEKEVMAEIKALRASRAGIAGYDQNFKELESPQLRRGLSDRRGVGACGPTGYIGLPRNLKAANPK